MTRTTAAARAVLGIPLAIAPASMNGQAPPSDVSLSYSAPANVTPTKLAYMRDPVGVECLGQLVTDPAFLHVPTAVVGLVRSGSPQARAVLEQLRVHPDPQRARAALDALDRLDRDDARKKAK